MADTKISGLTALTGANTASGDLLTIVDISDTTMAASGTNKKITLTELQGAPVSAGTANGVAYLNGSKVVTTGSALVFDGTNLGIGTSSPLAKLDVQGGSIKVKGYTSTNYSDGYSLLSGVTGNIGYIQSYYGNGSAVVGAPLTFDASYFAWRNIDAGYAERMRLDSSGNLGIGTSSPAGVLEVIGTNGLVIARSSKTASANSGSRFMGGAYTGNPATAILLDGVSGENQLNIGGGTGVGEPATFIRFYTGTAGSLGAGTERARIDSSGNLGLGVTPSAWTSGKALQFSHGAFRNSSGSTGMTFNAYLDTNWKYQNSGAVATMYEQASGAHYWYTAPSGTAGNAISFTQAMTLDASGNLGVGETSPALRLHVKSASAAIGYFETSDTGIGPYVIWRNGTTSIGDVGSGKGINGSGNATDFMIASRSTYPLLFGTGSTERARIDSSGNFQVGTAALATTATNGFLYIPTCAGTPTGTPTAKTGLAPIIIDSTNNKMYIYSGGAWVALN